MLLTERSVAEQVTDVSGRGVGLDVVKQQLEQLGGAVDLHSEVGVGTTFRLTIPVSMVLARTLVVEVAGVEAEILTWILIQV